MHIRHLLSIIFAISSLSLCVGQTPEELKPFEDSVMIHFRQSKVNLDSTYMGNEAALQHICQTIGQYNQPDSNFVLLNVKITGGASPEGKVRFNDWLSEQRARRITEYLDSRMILPDSVSSQTLLGPDWQGLRKMVAADPNVPYREDVLTLLDELTARYNRGEKGTDADLLRLKRLHGEVPYLYMYHHLFPYLRESNVVLTFGRPEPLRNHHQDVAIPIEEENIVEEEWPTPGILAPEIEYSADRPFYMALKTNLIADALALPELGAEFYLGKNISIVGNWMYGWWDRDRTHRYWRAYGGDLALRWWFGSAAHNKPLTGHHLGIYGGVVTYDFEFGGKGHMGGRPGHNLWDRCMHYFGVEYGYSLPIARRFNLDFTFGLGYMGGKYVEYHPNGKCYQWDATKQKHWYGPTKLEISLVWLIGHGNYNQK